MTAEMSREVPRNELPVELGRVALIPGILSLLSTARHFQLQFPVLHKPNLPQMQQQPVETCGQESPGTVLALGDLPEMLLQDKCLQFPSSHR